MKFLVYACLLMHILTPGARADGPAAPLSSRFIAYAIQGDLRPALSLFESAAPDGPPADRDLAMRFRQRFVADTEPPSPRTGNDLVDGVVAIYRRYWREALLAGEPLPGGEERLLTALGAALARGGGRAASATQEAIYDRLVSALHNEGFHALASHASPLQDLLVWQAQQSREFVVELVGQTRPVRVVFLSEFVSQGWKHYASLGLATTTGWVEGDTLYCVEWAYALDTENFEVSYLKHEAQHLADFERFPGLPSADLEYRAKLTELAYASTTLRRLLEDFEAKGAQNPQSPHAEANWRVVRDVYGALNGEAYSGATAWVNVDVGRVNRVARRLLVEDTQRLEQTL